MNARAAVWLLLVLIPISAAWGETTAEYDKALSHVQATLAAQVPALRVGEVLPGAQSPGFLAQRLLAPIRMVQMPGGAAQMVNNHLLLQEISDADKLRDLEKRARVYEQIERQITLLRQNLSVAQSEPAGRADPEQLAKTVLAGSVYQSDPLPPPSLSERFGEWLAKQWAKLHFRSPNYRGPTPQISPWVPKAILYVLAAGVFALLVYLIYLLVMSVQRRGARAQPLALDDTEAALVEARDTDSLLALADKQARSGDFRRAFRLVYVATLVALDTGGVLRFDRSKTNWEYLRALRVAGKEDVYQAMSPLTREFDRVWYGFAPADATVYARAVMQYKSLLAPSGPPAPNNGGARAKSGSPVIGGRGAA